MTDPTNSREPHGDWNDIDSQSDLIANADDSPDILQGVDEDEPAVDSASLHETAFRTPHAGDRLTEEQLEADVD
jgi:hypothetical protein